MHIKAQIEQVKKEIQGVQFQLDNDAHLSNTEVNKLDIKMAFLIGTLNLLISALYAPSIVRTENGTHLVKGGRISVYRRRLLPLLAVVWLARCLRPPGCGVQH